MQEINTTFWEKVEDDLATNIPQNIKNCFRFVFISNILVYFQTNFEILFLFDSFYSLCGYNDALSFIDFNDSDIDYIENSIKTKLLRHITEKLKPEDFFGPFFFDKPTDFEFTRGERKKIRACASYVSSVLDERGIKCGSDYFNEIKQISNKEETKSMTRTHFFLNKLIEAANRNESREPGGYRYNLDIKMYASLLRMISGPSAYDLLHRNLVCALPSLVSTNRYIQKSNIHIKEGILRTHHLLLYLKERNLPLIVTLSEDATKIEGRVQYDSKTNQIVGFPLPINKITGLPKAFAFKARNAFEMASHFEQNGEGAENINVVMARPVTTDRVPAFCLLVYATDNRYNRRDICKRWTSIVNELNEVGIKVLCFASDSDTKYNCSMRCLSLLGIKSYYFENCDWFYCGNKSIEALLPVYVQDIPHLGSKLRNHLLKTIKQPKLFPFGNKYFIQQSHLQYLLDHFMKDKHNLTAIVITPIDRMNFEESVLRICDEKVIELLRSSVVGSQATIKYLQIMKAVIDAYMDQKLTAIQRVEKMWYAVFMMRFWRAYVVAKPNLRLKFNFLSIYTYTCIEINAHSLVLLILHLKQLNLPQYFLTHLLNSQACEQIFRAFRSFTPVFSTVVNCSVKDAMCRMSKIELQNQISYYLPSEYAIPKCQRSFSGNIIQEDLPNELQIVNQIEKCKQDATQDALKFGLILKKEVKNFDFSCKIPPYADDPKRYKRKVKHVKPTRGMSYWRLLLSNVALKNYASKFEDEPILDTSPYVELPNNKTRRVIVRKSSLCWLLRKDYYRLSSDRLQRVKNNAVRSIKKRGKFTKVIAADRIFKSCYAKNPIKKRVYNKTH